MLLLLPFSEMRLGTDFAEISVRFPETRISASVAHLNESWPDSTRSFWRASAGVSVRQSGHTGIWYAYDIAYIF